MLPPQSSYQIICFIWISTSRRFRSPRGHGTAAEDQLRYGTAGTRLGAGAAEIPSYHLAHCTKKFRRAHQALTQLSAGPSRAAHHATTAKPVCAVDPEDVTCWMRHRERFAAACNSMSYSCGSASPFCRYPVLSVVAMPRHRCRCQQGILPRPVPHHFAPGGRRT
jgi:hypothetical protein